MNWRLFVQISLLIILGGIVWYFISPKYSFNQYNVAVSRCNKYTGKVEVCFGSDEEWKVWGKKKL